MADYIKATNFAAKDALPSGNSGKIVKGTEIDVELTAIATAITSKADTNSPTFTGTPASPTATAGTNTTQIATTAFVTTAVNAWFPSGGIIIWSGSAAAIPSGWLLCNGSNGTPDLRNRFVVGAGSTYAVGATGGSADAIVVAHTHSISGSGTTSVQSANHTHTFSGTSSGQSQTHSHSVSISDPGHAHTADVSISGNFSAGGPIAATNQSVSNTASVNSNTTGITATAGNASQDHTHTYSGTTASNSGDHTHTWSLSGTSGSAGSSGTNANLPPYYALCYIMKA